MWKRALREHAVDDCLPVDTPKVLFFSPLFSMTHHIHLGKLTLARYGTRCRRLVSFLMIYLTTRIATELAFLWKCVCRCTNAYPARLSTSLWTMGSVCCRSPMRCCATCGSLSRSLCSLPRPRTSRTRVLSTIGLFIPLCDARRHPMRFWYSHLTDPSFRTPSPGAGALRCLLDQRLRTLDLEICWGVFGNLLSLFRSSRKMRWLPCELIFPK